MAKNFQTNVLVGGKLLPSFVSAFSMANSKITSFTKNTSNTFTDIRKQAKEASTLSKLTGTSLISTFRAVRVATMAAGAGALYVGKKSLTTASDLQEAQNLQDVTFGKSSKAIDVWAMNADKAYGLSRLAAKNYVSTFGSVLKSAGLSDAAFTTMSKNLTGLAGDWSSFRNITQENAFEKIFSGVASGETEPLRMLGINMTVANLEAFALSKGIKQSYDSMNQATQMALRYAFVMDKSKDATGDFQRTQGAFANQQRLLGTNFSNLSAKISTRFLPVATKGYVWLNKFIEGIDVDRIGNNLDWMASKMDAAFTAMQPAISWVVNTGFPKLVSWLTMGYNAAKWFVNLIINSWPVLGPILAGIGTAFTVFRTISAAITLASLAAKGFGIAMMFASSPVGLIIIGIAALTAAVIWLYQNWDMVKLKVSEVWTAFTGFLANIPDWGLIFAGPLALVLLLIKHFDSVKQGALSAINAIKGFFGFGKGGNTVANTSFDVANNSNIPNTPLNIGHNATGTNNWRGGWSWVGEQGPELVNLPARSQVISNSRSMQMTEGSNIVFAPVISINGGSGDVESQARQGVEAAYPGFRQMIEELNLNQRRLAFNG